MGIIGQDTTQSLRQADLYFGLAANIYCVPNEFDYKPNSLVFNFDTWSSVESFEAGDDFIPRLRKSFEISGDEWTTVKAENSEMFTAIETIVLDLLRVGGRGYSIEQIFLSAIGKFMIMSASSPDGEHKPFDKFYLSQHDAIIAANYQTIAQATAFMIGYAKQHDNFLDKMIVSEQFQEFVK